MFGVAFICIARYTKLVWTVGTILPVATLIVYPAVVVPIREIICADQDKEVIRMSAGAGIATLGFGLYVLAARGVAG